MMYTVQGTEVKHLIENAVNTLEKLNEFNAAMKNVDWYPLLDSFSKDDLFTNFLANLNQTISVYSRPLRACRRKEKKYLADKLVTHHCKLRANKKQEKKFVIDQLLSIKSASQTKSIDSNAHQEPKKSPNSFPESEQMTASYSSDKTKQIKSSINQRSKKILKPTNPPTFDPSLLERIAMFVRNAFVSFIIFMMLSVLNALSLIIKSVLRNVILARESHLLQGAESKLAMRLPCIS